METDRVRDRAAEDVSVKAAGAGVQDEHVGAAPRGRDIVIDARGRDVVEGTGINSYARLLYGAVAQLGDRPHWLFGRAAKNSADRIEAEVTFHDPPVSSVGVMRQLEAVGRIWRGLTRAQIEAVPVVAGGVAVGAIADDELATAYNARDLYLDAGYRHEFLGKFIEVKAPGAAAIFHQTAPLPVTLAGARLVTTIHDLIPLRLPATTPDDKRRYIGLMRSCVRRADRIVTVSEASKADIVDILDVDPGKVAVTPLATDFVPLQGEERERLPRVLSRFGVTVGDYLLFVSAIEPKKNLRRLIDAFLEIDSDLPLVIVGRRAWMWEQEIGHLEATLGEASKKRVRFLGYVDRDDLRFLYAGARALAFPSLYEGFGLPALEAMTMGCPVLTSDIAPLREVCGHAAIYVDPYSSTDIRNKLGQLLGDAQLRASHVTLGQARAAFFPRVRFVESLGRAYAGLG